MSLRRSGSLALALLLAAGCKEVSKRDPAKTVYLAAFDTTSGTVPLPNDLALQAAPGQPAGIQREILFTYITGGGWPGDQVINIPIRTLTYDAASNKYLPSATPAPGIDAASFTAQTVAIVRVSDSPPTVLTPQLLAYSPDSVNPAVGVLRIRPVEGLAVGRYVVAVRGGDHGVKTSDHQPISADQIIALLAPDKDLANPDNQPPGGIPASQVVQLEQLRQTFAQGWVWAPPPIADAATRAAACKAALGIPAAAPLPEQTCWLPITTSPTTENAYAAVDRVFPHVDVASLQTFNVAAPAVVADTSAGVIPFPSDFMLDPETKKVRNLPALGPAAPGLATLDGFSTTGLLLAPLSAPVDVSTLSGNVFLFDTTDLAGGPLLPAGPAPGPVMGSPEYWLQPSSLVRDVGGGLQVTTAIGLQPGVPFPTGPSSVIPLPPLKPKTTYLVVITNGVKDVAGHPLVRGTLGNLLLSDLATPLVDTGGHSNIPGVSDADAAGLLQLSTTLKGLLPALLGSADNVVMAYTVHTQDVKTISAQLTALPYSVELEAGKFFTTSAPTDFDTTPFGIPTAGFATAFPHVSKFVSTTVQSLDVLDAATGALDPTLEGWGPTELIAARHPVPVLVAVPKIAGCAPGSPCVRPLVVFHHGIFGSRYQLIPVADALAAQGFVVVAADAPFHGDRAYCQVDADCNGGTCTLDAANQKAPGACSSGTLALDPARFTTKASGNYFISENFFRIRDAIREDLLDQSALILAAARAPTANTEPLFAALAGEGLIVDPTKVYFAGSSLGGMIGTSVVATNPRISRAAFNVAGGTLVDIFTHSPSFQAEVATLFAGLIPGFSPEKVDITNAAYDPVIAQQYAQTLIVAKWILDPAESVNYAVDVTTKDAADATLLATLVGLGVGVEEASVYGQVIEDDQVVPPEFGVELYGNAGLIPGAFTSYSSSTLPNDQRHGVLYLPTAAGLQVRDDLAAFLANLTVPTTGALP